MWMSVKRILRDGKTGVGRAQPGTKGRPRPPKAATPVIVIAVTAVALLVTSCSSGGGSTGSTRSGLTGTITISDWRFLENTVGPELEALYKSYSKVQPGVTVEFAPYSYDSYPQTIKTQIGAHSGPDVMGLTGGEFSQLQQAGALAPIAGLAPAEIKALVPQSSLGKVQGKQYGLVSTTTLYGFMYNKKLFKQAGITAPPATFDDFLADCKTIKLKTGKWGFAARNLVSESVSWEQDFDATFLAGYGGAWTNSTGKFTVDSSANEAAVNAFKKVYDSGCMLTGETAATYRPVFEEGGVGMMMDNSNAASTYTTGNSVVTNQDLVTSPPPFPTKKSGFDNVFLAVNNYSQNPQLAQAFLAWVFEPAQQQALANILAPVTVGTNVMPSKSFNQAYPWAQQYYTQLKTAVPLDITPAYENDSFADLLMPYIERVLDNQLSTKAALSQAQAAAVSQLGTS
jgi:multiple sugar transport system substrate-binding protein